MFITTEQANAITRQEELQSIVRLNLGGATGLFGLQSVKQRQEEISAGLTVWGTKESLKSRIEGAPWKGVPISDFGEALPADLLRCAKEIATHLEGCGLLVERLHYHDRPLECVCLKVAWKGINAYVGPKKSKGIFYLND
ncbi:MAG: hypothetical protein A2826_03125 [Candidatus Doudnabacteria bacterium RIFCSPHIGHO2_01_FULL_43_23]|uniref:Uncharacterized protein n=1 Tax=Candidatus Doudnabacteria bacterium RIFCSPHIGHO2_01_FULL_43_23 TaxID=1817822 RepID=A0A1F5NSA0_9BACT|nr:MAG: hypothetical protein A2826_03125 [Candidatus Doudnabacteria bacterium RIFCSPHIGHO2_01_FULL_43_23]